MNTETRIAGWKTAVESELERILSSRGTLLDQAMRYSTLGGGKRFRPLLLLASAHAFGVATRAALSFACAVELIHNYSLVHDDLPLMDDDDFRRGRPSCHKAFGEDIALLAGDSLLTMAFEIMAAAEMPRSRLPQKERAIGEIAKLAGVEGMIGGQLLDITFSPETGGEPGVRELMLKKTGALIVASVRAGAILGEATRSEIKALTRYGECIGLAFQVRDDIYDAKDKGQGTAPSRPNYASIFGKARAQALLEDSVRAALAALKAVPREVPELRRLARHLSGVQT